MGRLHAAIDVGGTFIDVIMCDAETHELAVLKLPNELAGREQSLLKAIEQLTEQFGANIGEIDTIVIGTTVVTNALLQGTLARTGLITTQGFRDVLEIARMERPAPYDLQKRRPAPLVPRHLRLEVRERVDADGQVLCPLDVDSVVAAATALRDADVQAVAVSLLFAFANPTHEQTVRGILAQELAVPVSLSSEVLPVFREYERTSTTAINAATTLVIDRFIESIKLLLDRGVRRVYIMGSEGGCLTLQEARRYPVRCIMSGPAGGVIGGLRLATRHGLRDALTLDVGGTSTDVALLQGGALPYTDERTVGGYAVALPSVEVETVGAGGGSVAYIDPTGLLRVGPLSAGADPGPICYLRGGTRPTVTDAHVALGHIGANAMLGGNFVIDRDAATRGIEEQLGRPLGLTWARAAQGILEVVTANIVRAVRAISVERGHDPRGLTLIAFGGAGPLHALDVARSLEVPRVLIPRYPGVWSAYGILTSDISYSGYLTWFRTWNEIDVSQLAAVFDRLVGGLGARVASDGLHAAPLRIDRAVDLRYRGQSHTLTVAVDELSAPGVARAAEAFHLEHERRYGHSARTDTIEVVNIRATIVYGRPTPDHIAEAKQHARPAGAAPQHRLVWLSDPEPALCPVHQRDSLCSGQILEGPAIVEQYDSTIVLSTGDTVEVMEDGLDLLVHVRPARDNHQGTATVSR